MNRPFLVLVMVLVIVACIGYATQRYSSWAKVVAVLATVALMAAGAAQLLL